MFSVEEATPDPQSMVVARSHLLQSIELAVLVLRTHKCPAHVCLACVLVCACACVHVYACPHACVCVPERACTCTHACDGSGLLADCACDWHQASSLAIAICRLLGLVWGGKWGRLLHPPGGQGGSELAGRLPRSLVAGSPSPGTLGAGYLLVPGHSVCYIAHPSPRPRLSSSPWCSAVSQPPQYCPCRCYYTPLSV